MSVVERCPSCGTTQATAGECEACHEAQVRYFCTNHEPGIWLAGPTCTQCEALAARAARPIPSSVAERARAPRPSRPTPPEALARAARRTRSPDEPAPERVTASVSPERGWAMQLVRRLALIALVLVVALGFAVYLVARSLR